MNNTNQTAVSAVVKDTGWPIDGHRLCFREPQDDAAEYELLGWEDLEDEAVRDTIWAWLVETGNTTIRSLEDFNARWDAKQPVTGEKFTLPKENLEDFRVEEVYIPQLDATLTPRKPTDKGGILLLPMKKNLGDVSENHPDWKLISCPECGAECYEFPEAHRLQLTQGVKLMCTECGIKAGIVTSYTPKNMPHPDGNRAKRRAAKKAARRRS